VDWINLYRDMDKLETVVNLTTSLYLSSDKQDTKIQHTTECAFLRYIHVTVHRNRFLLNNQSDAIIIQSYSVIKLYMFRSSSLPIIRSSVLYIWHW